MRILITAGTSGLGEAIVRRLAEGNEILFTYHSSKEKAEMLEAACNDCQSIQCDFSNEHDIHLLQEKITAWQPDVLINNAYTGFFRHTHFHKIEDAVFLDDFKNSVLPTIQVTQTAIEVFRKRKSGKIITILTSALFEEPIAGMSVYVANKAYLERMVRAWAAENQKFNITSNAVSPSFMLTKGNAEVDERIVEQLMEANQEKKLLTPADAAQAVYLLLHTASDVNGINRHINSIRDVI